MEKDQTSRVLSRHFKPSEMESLTGLTPVAIRDWRRRNIIHHSYEKEENGYHAHSVATLLFLKRISDHGLSPKAFVGWSLSFADMILRHTLDDERMWNSVQAFREFGEADRKHAIPRKRYLIIRTPPAGFHLVNDLLEAPHPRRDIETLVNLEHLGEMLRERFIALCATENPAGPLEIADDDTGELVAE